MYHGINFTFDLIKYRWYFQALLVPIPLKEKGGKEVSYGTI
jgi:hypothetical protein